MSLGSIVFIALETSFPKLPLQLVGVVGAVGVAEMFDVVRQVIRTCQHHVLWSLQHGSPDGICRMGGSAHHVALPLGQEEHGLVDDLRTFLGQVFLKMRVAVELVEHDVRLAVPTIIGFFAYPPKRYIPRALQSGRR